MLPPCKVGLLEIHQLLDERKTPPGEASVKRLKTGSPNALRDNFSPPSFVSQGDLRLLGLLLLMRGTVECLPRSLAMPNAAHPWGYWGRAASCSAFCGTALAVKGAAG